MPMRYSGPYEIYADGEDNMWIDARIYGVLTRFDQKTEKFTVFPYPEMGDHNPKITMDSQGTFWLASGKPEQLTSFKPKGNVPTRRSGK